MFQAWHIQKKIESPSKEHHWHFYMGRKHPKHTWDNLYSISFMFLQPLDSKVTRHPLPKACCIVWMLSLQRCLVLSSVLVVSFLPAGIWSQPDQGNWSFPSWVELPKLSVLAGRTASTVPACPMQDLPRWFFFFLPPRCSFLTPRVMLRM